MCHDAPHATLLVSKLKQTLHCSNKQANFKDFQTSRTSRWQAPRLVRQRWACADSPRLLVCQEQEQRLRFGVHHRPRLSFPLHLTPNWSPSNGKSSLKLFIPWERNWVYPLNSECVSMEGPTPPEMITSTAVLHEYRSSFCYSPIFYDMGGEKGCKTSKTNKNLNRKLNRNTEKWAILHSYNLCLEMHEQNINQEAKKKWLQNFLSLGVFQSAKKRAAYKIRHKP